MAMSPCRFKWSRIGFLDFLYHVLARQLNVIIISSYSKGPVINSGSVCLGWGWGWGGGRATNRGSETFSCPLLKTRGTHFNPPPQVPPPSPLSALDPPNSGADGSQDLDPPFWGTPKLQKEQLAGHASW